MDNYIASKYSVSIATKLSAYDDPKLNISLSLQFIDKTADSSWEKMCVRCHWSSIVQVLKTW